MKRTGVTQCWLATLALASLLPLSTAPAGAQSQGTIPQDRDSDVRGWQLSGLDQFLDSHPELSEQLRKDPSLVNNQEFVENHPALKQYLQSHPEVREQLNQNPNAVMHQQQRFDQAEDRQGSQDRGVAPGELASMNSFMDGHPEIAEQVRKDPSLLDNRKFVESHPALQQFLAAHPGVREEVRENPNAFLSAENRYDRRQEMRTASNMDQFLDGHPEISEQLRKNPALVNDKQFVEGHPALEQFLTNHPELRQEFKSNPVAFMQQEQRLDRGQDSTRGDADATRGELANMDRFLDNHPEIAEQIRKDPSLVNNKEFVEGHPALQQFLASHPGVRDEYRENPNAFMKQEQRFDQRRTAASVARTIRLAASSQPSMNSSRVTATSPANSQRILPWPPMKNISRTIALQTYLKANPQVKEKLEENPQSFVKSAQSFESTSAASMPKSPSTTPSKGTAKPAQPQK